MPKVTRPVKTCCICIETIKPEKEARITSCRHRYCKKCIRKWSKVNNRCPQCKRRFNWIIDVKRKKKEPEEQPVESIPTISEESSALGTIRINHSVIAGIVRLATQSVDGVVNVGGGGVVEGLTDFFSKKESERGVNVSEVE